MNDDKITKLIAAAQNADEDAAADLWAEYYTRLIAYARKKMAAMPRRAADEEDVVLSAMNSFLEGARQGRFQPQDRDELWKLLATITVRKATYQFRKHHAKKRGGGDVRGESVFEGRADSEGRLGINQIMDEALPEMSDQLTVTCRELLEQLDDDTLRDIAVMRLQGYTNEEIAEDLLCSLATVKRKLSRIREQWSSRQDSGE